MVLSILPLLVDAKTNFIRAPGLEETEESFTPARKASPPWWKARMDTSTAA